MTKILVAAGLLVGLAACRTGLFERPDDQATMPVDQASPIADFSTAQDAGPTVMCGGSTCNTATQLCVFLNRGDCSAFACVDVPTACLADRTCACLGNAFCKPLEMNGETLTCGPPEVMMPDTITCQSTTLCV